MNRRELAVKVLKFLVTLRYILKRLNRDGLGVRVLATFISLVCLGQLDMLFWWALNPALYNYHWVNLWGLKVTVYSSFCIFWLGVFCSLVLLWINYFWNWRKCQHE